MMIFKLLVLSQIVLTSVTTDYDKMNRMEQMIIDYPVRRKYASDEETALVIYELIKLIGKEICQANNLAEILGKKKRMRPKLKPYRFHKIILF